MAVVSLRWGTIQICLQERRMQEKQVLKDGNEIFLYHS